MGRRADHSLVGQSPRVLADYIPPAFWDQTEDDFGGTDDAGHDSRGFGSVRRGDGDRRRDCAGTGRADANVDVRSASLTMSGRSALVQQECDDSTS
jgi:hypothetical protein